MLKLTLPSPLPAPPSLIPPTQVEAGFYERVAPRLPPGAACHVPRCLGVHSSLRSDDGACGGGMQLVLTDLRPRFPSRMGGLDERHARAALSWLAAFHAACWGAQAAALGLWGEACYWHLDTRCARLGGGRVRAPARRCVRCCQPFQVLLHTPANPPQAGGAGRHVLPHTSSCCCQRCSPASHCIPALPPACVQAGRAG